MTETSANRITRIDRDGKLSTFIEPSNCAHGLAYDPKGRLIAAELGCNGGKPQIGVLAPMRATLADSYQGQPMMFMNDLVADRKGGIYFTESGIVNVTESIDVPRKGRYGTYYLNPDGRVIKLTGVEQITFPSGIILSPDEKTLYLNDLNQEEIWAYEVASNGQISNRKVLGRTETFSMRWTWARPTKFKC